MNKKSSRWMAGVALAGLLNGCGSESGAPSGSTIEVKAQTKEWEVSADSFPSYNDQPVVITVRGPNGNTINDVDITVSLDLAPGTVPLGDEAMFLFEDNDRDGVPDCRFDPVSPCPLLIASATPPLLTVADMAIGALAFPYRTKVDSFGSKQFVLRMSFGVYLSYRGDLNVISGSTFGSGNFEVSCADGPSTTCP